MKTTGSIILFMLLLVGCVAPPPVGPLTGGGLTIGREAEEFIQKAGVAQVYWVFNGMGNGVWVEDNVFLTARHVVAADDTFLQVDELPTGSRWIRAGDPADIGQAWVLVQTQLADPPARCQFAPTFTVTPGQEVLVVGYWAGDTNDLDRAVTVSGRVVATPEVFAHGASNLVCCDLGPQAKYFDGLSGSALLVKDASTSEWRLAGVFQGYLANSRGDQISICVALPKDLQEMAPGLPWGT